MRLYLPATIRSLERLHRDDALEVGDDAVIAVGDSEDEEYDALMTAAEAAGLLAEELAPGERRRVVIVAETTGPASDGRAPARVSLADVVAIHADPDDIPELGADPENDLGWYATQEIGDLLDPT